MRSKLPDARWMAVTLLLSVSALTQADLQRQHGAHVHGQGAGSLAQDDDRLVLELIIPGANLVGFEHRPRTDAQHDRLDQAMALLESGQWLQMDPDGACRVATMDIETPGFFGGPEDDHNDHHHDHAGGHDHAEFRLTATIDCDHVDRLGWVALELFESFPGNEMMAVDVLTDRRTDRVRLVPGRDRIDLSASR